MSLVDLEARRKLQHLNDRIEGISKVLANLESLVHVQRELASAHGNSITEISVALAGLQAPREGIEERLNEYRADLCLFKGAMEQVVMGSLAVGDCITDMELRLQALEGGESADSFEEPLPVFPVPPEDPVLAIADFTPTSFDSMPHQIFVTKKRNGEIVQSAAYARVD